MAYLKKMSKQDSSEGKGIYKPATRIFLKIQTGLAVRALAPVGKRCRTYLSLC